MLAKRPLVRPTTRNTKNAFQPPSDTADELPDEGANWNHGNLLQIKVKDSSSPHVAFKRLHLKAQFQQPSKVVFSKTTKNNNSCKPTRISLNYCAAAMAI